MKKLLNTLYVTQHGMYLHKERETVVVELERKIVLRVPIIALQNIFCFGRISTSPQLMAHCAEAGIGMAFFSEHGRFYARVEGKKNGNVLLRRHQYRIADTPDKVGAIVQKIIGAKIANSRLVIMKSFRNRPDVPNAHKLEKAGEQLNQCLRRVLDDVDVNSLRGREGESANIYFSVFNILISQQKNLFYFTGRNRRPPKDPVNAVLSFLYSLLMQDCASAAEGVGLDSYVGFLHRDRPGRQGLALDLMEEFRSFVADRLCLTLINLRQLSDRSFSFKENGAVFLNEDGRKVVLQQYQKRKQDEVFHPVVKESVKIGMLFHVQALLLARHLRGDISYYPAFIGR